MVFNSAISWQRAALHLCPCSGTMNQSAWRSGQGQTRGSPALTTSCWPCSPPSSVSPWRVGPPSCTGWEKQLQDDINGTMYCKLKGIHFHCLVLVLFCSFAKINKKLFHVLASLADKWRTPKVSQIVLASQSSWNYFPTEQKNYSQALDKMNCRSFSRKQWNHGLWEN